MWLKKTLFYFLILILLLSACQSEQPAPLSTEAQQIISIGLQPTLAYLKEPMSVCADQDPTYDILLLEKNSYDWANEPVDVVITSQHALESSTNTFLIDEVEIAIIASPNFPFSQLTLEQLQAIYNTEMVTPPQIGLAEDAAITIYGFETNSDMATLFENQFGFSPQLPVDAFLATGTVTVVDKVASDSLSVGYTLSPAVSDQVKQIQISNSSDATRVPVVASFFSTPSLSQESLIRCLQNSLLE
jgi:hypothetical protein